MTKGHEIVQFIKSQPELSACFQGLSEFERPPQLKENSFTICLKNKSHWCVYSRFSNFEIFDSLGCTKAEIEQFLPGKEVFFNETPLQCSFSDNCAKFCLYFIVCRINNPDMCLCVLLNTFFSRNCSENEKTCIRFFTSGDFNV